MPRTVTEKKCNKCGKKKNIQKHFKKRPNQNGYTQPCIECRKTYECLWCGKKVSPGSKFCKKEKGAENCSYKYHRVLALNGEIPPTRMMKCSVCGVKYPFYAVLANKYTCSTTSGSECSNWRKGNYKDVLPENRKDVRPDHHLHDSCRQHPLCVNFLTCHKAGFPDHKKDGSCYSAPLQRGSIDSSSIHAYHPSCFG